MSPLDSQAIQPVGSVADGHELTERARSYGESVVRGDEWPIDGVDLAAITWATSTRAKRRHGRCSYDGGGQVTITLTEHTYERAGFDACKKTVRHELVHAWQYQHQGQRAVVGETGIELRADGPAPTAAQDHSDHADTEPSTTGASTAVEAGFTIETGHGDSFLAWVEPLELPGRTSSYYERRRSDFAYVYECPDCGSWWGKHRLCKSVRQAAHGGNGSSGYRYCTDCEVLLHLRVGEWFLDHDDHDDRAIKYFVDGAWRTAASSGRQPEIDVPVSRVADTTGSRRPAY
ncbi:SprT-like domain-containing protein [Halohasta litorea]|uniref:SprT-like domain-containing protein n=1 Tax=Halohasta litorea TaxID=869891 RepID=A0ABD6D7S5_9EURY|nr:SprT-like domain-containing protein [Halohasta litorea]